MLSRRAFLSVVGVAGISACRSTVRRDATALATHRPRHLERIGIQLYTVRGLMQTDAAATLARLAGLGYHEVEFAGYFGRSPREVRALLKRSGLSAPSTHVAVEAVVSERVFDESAEIGHRYVTVPWIPAERRRNPDDWRRLAAELNRAGELAHSKGLRLAYHNQEYDLVPASGAVPLRLLLDATDPALVFFQMDVFWHVKAGGDPIAFLRDYPTRFSMLHIKDSGGAPEHRQVDVGAGTIDFATILRQDGAQRRAIEHVFVEHDEPADAMTFARTSFDYLSRMEH